MILYLIFAAISLVVCLLFSINKYPLKGYKECKSIDAKKVYRLFGIISTAVLTLGFLFMAFYDLSVNKTNELIVLEVFGLLFILSGVILIIFGVLNYNFKLNDYKKTINDNSNETIIRQDCEKESK